jgi:hypothetical protein
MPLSTSTRVLNLCRRQPILSTALLGLALAGGCAKAPDDAALVASINSQVMSDAPLNDASLQVTSQKGIVTLSGIVTSEAARQEALKIASHTPGVKKVNDEISVQAAPLQPGQPGISSPESTAAAIPAESSRKDRPRKSPAAMPHPTDGPQPMPSSPPLAAAPQIPAASQPVATSLPVPVAIPAPPPPSQPKEVLIPANTTMTIRMIDGVDSSVNHSGEIFHAALDVPILVGNDVAAPRGADVYVRLTSASKAGRLLGKGELILELVKLEFQGRSYPLVTGTYNSSSASKGKDTAKKVGSGAVLGAIIGAIAAGGKGAAIGAAAGAGAGGVVQSVTKGKQVQVPSETKLDFLLEQPVTVTILPHPAPPAN